MYREYQPDIRLSNLVECYWCIDEMGPDSTPVRVIPDGCVDIIFSFSGDNCSQLERQGQPFINGTMTYSFDTVHSYGITEMIGVRFMPAGITAFTRSPIHELTDLHMDLRVVDHIFDSRLYEELPGISSAAQRVWRIEQYLLSRLPIIYEPDKRVIYASKLMLANQGQKSVSDIIHSVCLSERQFERKFKSAIGVSPKTFSKIIRFRHTYYYMLGHPEDSLYNVAMACGYYDHSHLLRDLKRFG